MTAAAGDRRPETVSVSRFGELRGDRPQPGSEPMLRILVGCQHAGFIAPNRDGTWGAIWKQRVAARSKVTRYPSAAEALAAVMRSGFARHLGARKASPVRWSPKASRVAGRDPRAAHGEPGDYASGDRITVAGADVSRNEDVTVVRVNQRTVTALTDGGLTLRFPLADVLGRAGAR